MSQSNETQLTESPAPWAPNRATDAPSQHTGTDSQAKSSYSPTPTGPPTRNTVRHPPRSGWLDELGRLKGGWPIGSRRRALRA
jgi:hypothetical protein